jgi:glycosyltransferase involved in cell wall biosynthesis
MKICVVSNLYSPLSSGGAEIHAQQAAEALADKNDVFVITTKPFTGFSALLPYFTKSGKTKIYRFYPLNLFHVSRLRKSNIPLLLLVFWRFIDIFNLHTLLVSLIILRREKPDIIHTHNLGGMSFSLFWAAELLRIPLAHTVHDFHLLCPYAGLLACKYNDYRICSNPNLFCRAYSLLKKIVFDKIPALVVSPSRFAIEKHKAFGFFSATSQLIIPYFLPQVQLCPKRPGKKEYLVFLYIGKLSPEKGIGVLLEAFRRLDDGAARLHIAGEGWLGGMIESCGLSDKRIVFFGRQPHEQLSRIYGGGDFTVVPSMWLENFPMVILESLSYGIPVIASDIGGIPEQIKDGYNGFLFSMGSMRQLLQILQRVMGLFHDDYRRIEELKLNAFISAQQYSANKILPRLEEEYKECTINR